MKRKIVLLLSILIILSNFGSMVLAGPIDPEPIRETRIVVYGPIDPEPIRETYFMTDGSIDPEPIRE